MLQNLHTHSVYCDGKDEPAALCERALELGMDSLGFSSHAMTSLNRGCECRGDRYVEYKAVCNKLKKEYEGRLKIFLGVELDRYSHGVLTETEDLDYTIGGVHYALVSGDVVAFDSSYDHSKKMIDEKFGGNGRAFYETYYNTMVDMSRLLRPTFIAHFDVLTKFSDKHPPLFDKDSGHYRSTALSALDAVRERHEFFEVNVGAVARGYRNAGGFYPAPFIVDRMRELGCKLLITSDCHNGRFLTDNFNEAKEYLKSHGYNEIYNLTDNGFVGEKI